MQHEDRAAYCIFSMGQACLGLTLTAEHPSLTVSSSRGRCKLGQDVAACVRLHERICVHERTNFVRMCVYGHACAYERVTGSGCVCGKKKGFCEHRAVPWVLSCEVPPLAFGDLCSLCVVIALLPSVELSW